MTEAPVQLTVGKLAERFHVQQHQVAHVIKSRNIRPAFRVGILRVFDEKAALEIERVLNRIKTKRTGVQP
jgi:plasmid maintenance system antidote protein VapI